MSTTGALDQQRPRQLDVDRRGRPGGSTLSIAGALTNTGTLDIGATLRSVTANSFVNSGTVESHRQRHEFRRPQCVGNDDQQRLDFDRHRHRDARRSCQRREGVLQPHSANLQFDSSVSSGQTITETGADALTLKEAQSFAATISGFGTGDTIDATNFLETATSYNFVENIAGTGGTLTLTDASPSLTANIQMTGVYSNKSFTLAPDSGTGTLVKFV